MYSLVLSPISLPTERITSLLYVDHLYLPRQKIRLTLFQVDGEFVLVYGTSCSSPVSGAIFTMINDARLAVGKSTIGFINPAVSKTVSQRALHFLMRLFPVDLFFCVCRRVQRYHQGQQSWMRNQRIQCHIWLGSCDWSRNAELPQVARSLAQTAMRGWIIWDICLRRGLCRIFICLLCNEYGGIGSEFGCTYLAILCLRDIVA